MKYPPLPAESPKRFRDDRIAFESPCICGSAILIRGFKGQRYRQACTRCGHWHRGIVVEQEGKNVKQK